MVGIQEPVNPSMFQSLCCHPGGGQQGQVLHIGGQMGRPARHGHEHGHGQARPYAAQPYVARRPVVPCHLGPPCPTHGTSTALCHLFRDVSCSQARQPAMAAPVRGYNRGVWWRREMTQSQGGGNRRPALRRSGGGRRGGEWRETADGAAAPRLDGDGGGRGQHGGRRDHQPRPHGGGARATCSRDAEGQRLS
jgi:hypothetical protein